MYKCLNTIQTLHRPVPAGAIIPPLSLVLYICMYKFLNTIQTLHRPVPAGAIIPPLSRLRICMQACVAKHALSHTILICFQTNTRSATLYLFFSKLTHTQTHYTSIVTKQTRAQAHYTSIVSKQTRAQAHYTYVRCSASPRW